MDDPQLTPAEARVKPWFAIDGDKNLRIDYPLNKSSLVYDVGGYLGEWAQPIYKRYGCRIEVFEPVASFANKIEKKFKNSRKVKVYNFGLGASDRKTKINLEGASSSTLKSTSVKETIQIVAADKIIKVTDRIDLMKINIEGGEYELLEHLIETGLIKNVADIQVQFHIFVREAPQKRQRLQSRLSKTHHLTYNYPWIWENWRRK
ncbi:MAG TPA: FkbM family methyltransferase [Candidatus Nitrosopolaris sp.]|nr:FkbM family methyltransferase [Candidatus Nitrosopolaris sp.]